MRRVVVVGIVLAALAVGGCGGSGDDKGTDASKPASAQRESFVFVQDARGASIDTRKGTLTLRGTSPSVQYFSDRPERIAGSTSVDAFSKSWGKVFGADPPNASIQDLTSRSGNRARVVELLGPPRYTGGRTLAYRVKLVDAPRKLPRKVELAGVSMFIDAGSEDGADLAPQRVGHCSPLDPRCATAAGASSASPCPSVTDPGPCRGAPAKVGCTSWDPRCATGGARDGGGVELSPYRTGTLKPVDDGITIGARAGCKYSPQTPDCPTLEDRPGCSTTDTRDCPARGPGR